MNTNSPPVCNYEGSDYQTSFWEKGGRAYEDAVEAVALRRLLPAGGNLFLELGAGAGRNTPRYRGFKKVVLVDYSRTQLEQAQQRLGNSSQYMYVAADVYHLPFTPGLFDAATLIRTLHHMSDAPAALHQVRLALKPNSSFILEFANKQNIKSILRYLTGQQMWNPFSLEPVEFTELNFDFHPESVRTWLKENDFSLLRQLSVSHFRINLFKKLIPLGILVKADSIAQLTGDWWQLSPSIFVLTKTGADTLSAVEGEFFRCPACGHYPLPDTPPKLICTACNRVWPCTDGIYDFRY